MLLDKVKYPEDLKKIERKKLVELAQEIRERIIEVVSKNGGHLAPSLGAVELSISLLYVFNPPKDKIVWDVGHQSYAYKILTGRNDKFDTIRQYGGLSGFNSIFESEYDFFTVGHASTSISAALGMAKARDLKGEDFKVVAIIGDGALTGGLALEGLNNAGTSKTDIIVILNDNGMSISPNVGALSHYLTKVISNPLYNTVRIEIDNLLNKSKIGGNIVKTLDRLDGLLKGLVTPGRFFEDFGFRYFGPIDGHNIDELIDTLDNIKNLPGPKILHIKTIKGKGYKHAEKDATKFHGISSFEKETGEVKKKDNKLSYSKVAGTIITKLGEEHKNISVIVAAMPSGTGTDIFQKRFPERYFDVGIAEGHAVTFAGGLATQGILPYVFIYSTFLQRAYDEIIHDIALQNLGVVFCVDRAGLVGEDGPTHHGVFDLGYFGIVPNIEVWAPTSLEELRDMLYYSYEYIKKNPHPLVIRYPRASDDVIDLNKIENVRDYKQEDVVKENIILAVGSQYKNVLEAVYDIGDKLDVIRVNKVYPLNEEFFERVFSVGKRIMVVEEVVPRGSFGANLIKWAKEKGFDVEKFKDLTLPDEFITHGPRDLLLEIYGLKGNKLRENIIQFFSL